MRRVAHGLRLLDLTQCLRGVRSYTLDETRHCMPARQGRLAEQDLAHDGAEVLPLLGAVGGAPSALGNRPQPADVPEAPVGMRAHRESRRGWKAQIQALAWTCEIICPTLFFFSDDIMSGTVHVGLVGCSWFAQHAHLPALLELEGGGGRGFRVRLVAVCSRTRKSMARAEATMGRALRRHARMEDLMADEEIDVVLLVLLIL